MKNATTLVLFTLITSFFSCKKEQKLTPLDELPYGQYLKTFNDLADKHGLDVEKDLRKLKFQTIDGYAEGTSACSTNVILVPTLYEAVYGEDFTGQFIYHQMGHCILGRNHRDDIFENGEWKSLMRSEPYLSGLGQAIDFEGQKKEYYLEELFNEQANPADFSFQTSIIPFDETLPRQLVLDVECGVIYDELMPSEAEFDLEIEFDFYAPPSSFLVSMFDNEKHYLRIWQQDVTGKFLLFDNNGFGPRFSFDVFDFPNYDEGFTLTIRNFEGKCSFYINKTYMFTRITPPIGLHQIIGYANTQIGSCPDMKLYAL